VRVRVGLADTQRTQVTPLQGQTLAPGTEVVTGTTSVGAGAAGGAAPSNPLTPTRTGPGGGRP
jgi:hypothetical protein